MEPKIMILKLYRDLLREAHKYPHYNFRNYAIRRLKDRFKELDMNNINKEECIEESKETLDQLKRMRKIASLYAKDDLVIEKLNKIESPSSESIITDNDNDNDNDNNNDQNNKNVDKNN